MRDMLEIVQFSQTGNLAATFCTWGLLKTSKINLVKEREREGKHIVTKSTLSSI